MAVSKEYRDHILDLLSEVEGVTARGMFGGAGLYLDGIMFGLLSSQEGFYLRVDDQNRADFEAHGSGPFAPQMGGSKPRHAVMPYYEVPAEIMEDADELAHWARRAWEAAKRAKKTKRKKKA